MRIQKAISIGINYVPDPSEIGDFEGLGDETNRHRRTLADSDGHEIT